MESSLSNKFSKLIDEAAPLITFFLLPAKQQVEVLPELEEEKKYNFPERVLITNNALKVLIASYLLKK